MYELRDFTKKNNKNFEILDPWEETKKLYPDIREDTILNIDDEVRLDYFEKAYKIVADNLNDLRVGQQDTVVAIPMHPVFYWKSGFKDAIRDNFLDWLSPDLFITVIHNLRELKSNLDRDKYSRFPDITLLEILQWRDREMKDTTRWAVKFKKDHIVLARKEPIETSYGVLFTNNKRIYFSYPMSYVSP